MESTAIKLKKPKRVKVDKVSDIENAKSPNINCPSLASIVLNSLCVEAALEITERTKEADKQVLQTSFLIYIICKFLFLTDLDRVSRVLFLQTFQNSCYPKGKERHLL